MLWLVTLAMAGELNLSYDRGGIGESTGTPGGGHAIIAGSVLIGVSDPVTVGTNTVIGRIGLDDGLEFRIRVPDVTLGDGTETGGFHIGAKIAGVARERWSASVVPELILGTDGAWGMFIGTNAAVDLGDVSVWVHAGTTALADEVSLLSGGGVAYHVGGHGLYIHSAAGFATDGFIGGGGWLRIAPTTQLDAGVDVSWAGDPTILVGIAWGSDGDSRASEVGRRSRTFHPSRSVPHAHHPAVDPDCSRRR